jgi:chromosome segregation ATPase
MNPLTLTTILNTAQLIIQGADKLSAVIRSRNLQGEEESANIPASLEGMRSELQRLHERLDQSDDTNVEQLQMIEQLAKQNEALAASLQTAIRRAGWALVFATAALFIAILLLAWILLRT